MNVAALSRQSLTAPGPGGAPMAATDAAEASAFAASFCDDDGDAHPAQDASGPGWLPCQWPSAQGRAGGRWDSIGSPVRPSGSGCPSEVAGGLKCSHCPAGTAWTAGPEAVHGRLPRCTPRPRSAPRAAVRQPFSGTAVSVREIRVARVPPARACRERRTRSGPLSASRQVAPRLPAHVGQQHAPQRPPQKTPAPSCASPCAHFNPSCVPGSLPYRNRRRFPWRSQLLRCRGFSLS